MILFQPITSRVAAWALYPTAARGYLAGEQDPAGDPGEGLVTFATVPGAAWVEVRHELSRTVVATVFSAADGSWQVPDLPSLDTYEIFARDPNGVWETVSTAGWLPYV